LHSGGPPTHRSGGPPLFLPQPRRLQGLGCRNQWNRRSRPFSFLFQCGVGTMSAHDLWQA
jgi:hypothetical protein